MSAGRKDDFSNSIEISVRGTWIWVPALEFEGKMIVLRGTWIKLAVVHDEELLDSELGNPEVCAERLRHLSATPGLRTDIFTLNRSRRIRLRDTTMP
jgi:hypothetical protein